MLLRRRGWRICPAVYSGDFSRDVQQRLHAHDASLSMQTATEVGYLTTALALVGAGLGLAMVPDYARTFADNFGIRFLALNREFFVHQRRCQALSTAADAFAGILREHGQGQ